MAVARMLPLSTPLVAELGHHCCVSVLKVLDSLLKLNMWVRRLEPG
jgi:hypothetical protein